MIKRTLFVIFGLIALALDLAVMLTMLLVAGGTL